MAKDFGDFKTMVLDEKLDELDGIITERLAQSQDTADDPATQFANTAKTYAAAMALLILEEYHHWLEDD